MKRSKIPQVLTLSFIWLTLSGGNSLNAIAPQNSTCPADVQTLTSRMIRDLPNYANRVIQRSRRLSRTFDSYSYVLIAGRPEFEPLPLGSGDYTPTTSIQPQQVFITTLERRYTRTQPVQLQLYHWLFLTQTSQGWRLATMFTTIGSYPGTRPPTPPLESSDGVVGQAVSLWLRDCNAGALK